MKVTSYILINILCISLTKAQGPQFSCRFGNIDVWPIISEEKFNGVDRSNHLRQDGGLCFEIPPWQHQPVELEQHVSRLKHMWALQSNHTTLRRQNVNHLALVNSEVTRYMDTVIAPFLDTYHRNIQNAYQQLTSKILRRIKEEINIAVKKKQQISDELNKLATDLEIPPICDEERRAARTLASSFVAQIYACTEDARTSIAKMGKYAEEMIAITRNHMQVSLGDAITAYNLASQKTLTKNDVLACLKQLSKSAASLGYELDLSLTNARRHNEQSCEKLSGCSGRIRKKIEDNILDLKDLFYQCVDA